MLNDSSKRGCLSWESSHEGASLGGRCHLGAPNLVGRGSIALGKTDRQTDKSQLPELQPAGEEK